MSSQEILSPLPGVFYRRPSPEEAPYKSEGDKVQAGDVIGLIEVMKSFHEVKIESSGKIVKFLVENEGVIMAGQPIAEIET